MTITKQPIMHCHNELEKDLGYREYLPDDILMKWFNDSYSTSKHLLTLYSLARGLKAKTILEIGFGRSTFVLAKAAAESNGQLISCDNRDFAYLLNKKELENTKFILGTSDKVWNTLEQGIDFAFLDYFSSKNISKKFCKTEIRHCLKFIKTNGIITLHDSLTEEYSLKAILKKIGKRKEIELMTLPFNYGLTILRFTGKSKFGMIQDNFTKKQE